MASRGLDDSLDAGAAEPSREGRCVVGAIVDGQRVIHTARGQLGGEGDELQPNQLKPDNGMMRQG